MKNTIETRANAPNKYELFIGQNHLRQVIELKRTLVERALADANGNFDVAAAMLDLSPSYLRRLARSLNVKLL